MKSQKIIGCYLYSQYGRKGKIEKVHQILKEYRITATCISKYQWYLFFSSGRFNKYSKVKHIKSALSEGYKQTILWQVVSILESFTSNIANRVKKLIINSTLSKETKEKLLFINSIKGWFLKLEEIRERLERKKKNLKITDEDLKLARKLFKYIYSRWRKPSFKHISMHLDSKVAVVEKNRNSKEFDYWIKLSTLEKGKPVYVPLKLNKYADNLDGKLLNFCQIVEEDGEIKIMLVKELKSKKDSYVPATESIAIDLGLNPLIATDKGDLIGRHFLDRLRKFDEKITKRMKSLQKRSIKPSQDEKYKELVKNLREYLKNEINRFLNRLVDIHRPKQIVIERLNLQQPNLSKRLNRLIQNFGKGYFREKLDRLKEIYGIEVIEVNPAYTSQECSNCGYVGSRNRKNTNEFKCEFCNKKINAQVNGAKNILKRASLLGKNKTTTTKKQILDMLVKRHIERLKGCNSAALDILKGNPYYGGYLDEYLNPVSSRNKFL